MPGYPTHSRWGRVGAVVVAIVVGSATFALLADPLLAVVGAIGAGITTFVGSVYPDVDHHESVPRRKAVRAFRVATGLGGVGLGVANWDALLAVGAGVAGSALSPFVATAGLVAVAVLVLVAAVDPVIGIVTGEHRSWTHSNGTNLALLAVGLAGVWVLTGGLSSAARFVALAVAGSFYLGTLIHLGLDGELLG